MGQTEIEWSDYTFNPLWGCQRVSPGCVNCYAEAFDKRLGGKHWGPGSQRRTFGEKHWAQPLAWNAKAAKDGRVYRVFCASMADWLEDHPDWVEPRARLEELVAATPNLIWLFLTKRPENWHLMPTAWHKFEVASRYEGVNGDPSDSMESVC
jgi:protein gp37